MPAKTQAQQAAFGIASAVKKGKMKAKPGSPSAKIANTMSASDIDEFASTPVKGLPKKTIKKNPKKRTTNLAKMQGGSPPRQRGFK